MPPFHLHPMDKNLNILDLHFRPILKPEPRLKLLVELEPRHKAFFGNFADLFRRPPSVTVSSKPGVFWKDVFVYTGVSWWRLFESLLWQALAVVVLFTASKVWTPRVRVMERRELLSHVTYYTPPAAFPALGNTAPEPATHHTDPLDTVRRALRVAPQRKQSIAAPPVLSTSGSRQPTIPQSSHSLPAMPFSATARSQLSAHIETGSIVAPPPTVSLGTAPRASLPQASAVAPSPSLGAVSSGRAIVAPGATVVAPTPILQALPRGLADINIGRSQVVNPSPQLPVHDQHTPGASQATLGGAGAAAVVPPSPSIGRSGSLSGGRMNSLSGAGSEAIPPSPSLKDVRSSIAGGQRGASSAVGSQVVPPTPSIQGIAGSPRGVAGTGSFSSAGPQVVPPSPSAQGAGGSAGGMGRAGSFSSSGSEVVPPSPTVGGTGNSRHGTGLGSLSGESSAVAPPSADAQGAGNSAAAGEAESAGAGTPSSSPQSSAGKQPTPPEELALRLVGLVLALPKSSYFSNYEVFIAERRGAKGQSEFIKLVYEFLPYQRALSQYAQNNTKVFKLRVTRDATCDETLMQMTWPEADPHPQNSADSPGLSANDRNGMLPCYRTTADDYRKALSRRH